MTGATVPIQLEYYENDGDAVAELSWIAEPSAGSCPKGLYFSEYFANQTLSGTAAGERCEAAVDYDWGLGGPTGVGVGTDNFSVRWVKTQHLPAGDHELKVEYYENGGDPAAKVSIAP